MARRCHQVSEPIHDTALRRLSYGECSRESTAQVLAAVLLPPYPGGEICWAAAHLTMLFLPTHFLTITILKHRVTIEQEVFLL
jgi:hypothetical protein